MSDKVCNEELYNEKFCRICFEPASETNKLINPCLCTGSSKFVHETCLQQWRDSADIDTQLRRTECMECKYNYIIVQSSNQSYFTLCCSSLIVKKKLYITPILSFLLCYINGEILCTQPFTRDWLLPENIFTCYNITPLSIIGLYIIIIFYCEILLHKYNTGNPYALLGELPLAIILSFLILFTLGPLGITLISAIMNILIQTKYLDPMLIYLRPKETILNYQPESPHNDVIVNLEYKPPSPSPPSRQTSLPRTSSPASPRTTSPRTSSPRTSSPRTSSPRTSSPSPTSSISSTTPLNPESPITPTTPRPYIESPLTRTIPRPTIIIPPEIQIVYTNENILHTS